MKNVIYLTSVLFALSLTACHSSNNNGTTSPSVSAVGSIAGKSQDSDPTDIGDPSAIQQDLSARFGGADGEPIDLQNGESLSDVLSRVSP